MAHEDPIPPRTQEEAEALRDRIDPETRARRDAALKLVRQYGDPVLRGRALEVERFDERLAEEVRRMGQVMHDALGIGLAATQVGVMHRVLVYRVDPDAPVAAVVNPVLEWASEEREPLEEGCLSLPGVLVEVERPVHVRVRAQDEHGDEQLIEASGLEARVLQHEMDHLDGVLILDRTSRDQRKQAMRALREVGTGSPPLSRRRLGSVRTVYLGTSSFAATVLEALAASEHRPALVVTRPDAPRGRGRRLLPPPVAEKARELGLELIQPERLHDEDVLARIAAAEPEALAVCAYGALIREPLLSAYEILNVHPSLLPRWRGAAPIERAIMAGDEVTGVSIIRLVEALDAGPVCLQAELPIGPDDDYGTLSARLEQLSGELLVRALVERPAFDRAGRGRRHLRAQDRGARPRAGLHAAARGRRAPGARAAPAHRRAAAAARRRVHGRRSPRA